MEKKNGFLKQMICNSFIQLCNTVVCLNDLLVALYDVKISSVIFPLLKECTIKFFSNSERTDI